MKKILFALAISGLLASCKNDANENNVLSNDPTTVANTSTTIPTPVVDETPGIIGVFDIPEILTLAIRDSAKQEDIGFKIGKANSAIEADINNLGLSTEYRCETEIDTAGV